MRETANTPSAKEKPELNIDEKVRIWESVFGPEEYNPEYNYSSFFKYVKNYIRIKGYIPGYRSFSKKDKEKIYNLIDLVENNNYKIDIRFLESLNDDEKYLISRIFIGGLGEKNVLREIEKQNLIESAKDKINYSISKLFVGKGKTCDITRKFKMGKSLLIRMLYRINHDNWNSAFTSRMMQLRREFTHFDFFEFYQAFNTINENKKYEGLKKSDPTKFLFAVLAEYNLIKNLKKNVKDINDEMDQELGEDFTLGIFHTRNEQGVGSDEKYGRYSVDKDGKETLIDGIGYKPMVDENGIEIYGANILDRGHKSGSGVDASGKAYRVYLDSPTGISLFCKDEPVAVIAFFIRNGNELFINQIQRVSYKKYDEYGRCVGKEYSSSINGIDWKRILYEVAKKIAEKHGITRIVIQGGKNNKRTKKPREKYCGTQYYEDNFKRRDSYLDENVATKYHLDLKIAKQIYDVFAINLGFEPDNDGNYFKDYPSNES